MKTKKLPPNKTIQQSDGSYRFSQVGSGNTPLPHFDTVKDTGHLVRSALQSPPGKTILGAGSMLSWTGMFKTWCEINHVPYNGYDATPLSAFEKMLPIPDLGPEMGEMFLYFDEFGYTGGEAGVVLAQDVRSFPFFLAFFVCSDGGRRVSWREPGADLWGFKLGVPCPLNTWEEYIKSEGVWADVL